MDPVKASATAVGVAVARGAHRSYDQPPLVLDDPFALRLAGPQWAEIQAANEAALPEAAVRQSRASVVARSRYAEDRLISGGYRQYVILGAGLDSIAWRQPGLIGWLRLFEVDHPASQAWKQARLAELGLPVRDGHVFAAVDFETEPLREGLNRAGLDWSEPAFFSWLGVMMYLTTEAIEATLGCVSGCGPGRLSRRHRPGDGENRGQAGRRRRRAIHDQDVPRPGGDGHQGRRAGSNRAPHAAGPARPVLRRAQRQAAPFDG